LGKSCEQQTHLERDAEYLPICSAYPIASLGHANWILRHFGYRATFIWGLFLYGVGALVAFPCVQAKSFGGFCAAIFIIGNGLGSLETAANPYITGMLLVPAPKPLFQFYAKVSF
jgi:fucose permease